MKAQAVQRKRISRRAPHVSAVRKTCQKCGESKRRETEFHRNRCTHDGYQAWCKDCQNKWMQDYYELRQVYGVFEPRSERQSKKPIEDFYKKYLRRQAKVGA